jgi:sugar transferase (PEP-CTERM/EpsH1 system associated)
VTPDRRPLILHVIHHLVIGGMENGVVNLINHLPTDVFRHAVACVEDFSDFRLRITRPDVEVVALHRSRIGAMGIRREIYRICGRWRPALLHSRNLSGLDALLPARMAGVRRSIHSEHGWSMNDLDGSRWRPILLRRLHSPLVDQYVTVSKDLKRFLTDQIGISPRRIMQIYNGVDTSRFTPGLGRTALQLPPGFDAEDVVRIGSVGRIQAVKDYATLFHAMARLLDRRPALRSTARLVLVGDGPLLNTMRALAANLGIADIAWLPGSTDNVPRLMQALDVFVLPSLNEGVSNTILEAMATGLPVLASAVGGNVELVEDRVTGRLFPAGNAEELATRLEDYLDNAALRRTHGRAARVVAQRDFSLATMVDRYHTVYDQALNNRRESCAA